MSDAPSWLVSVLLHATLVLGLGLIYRGSNEIVKSEMIVSMSADDSEVLGRGGSGDDDRQPLEESFDVEMPPIAPEAIASIIPETTPLAEFNELTVTPLASAQAATFPQLDFAGLRSLDIEVGSGGGIGIGRGIDQGSGVGPGSGHGAGGGHAYTSVFGLAGEGGRFVYVFDRSESMNSVFTYSIDGEVAANVSPLDAAKTELILSLDDLGDSHYFQIVFYGDEPMAFGGSLSLASASATNKQQAEYFVESTRAEGNTNHLLALEMALQCNPDTIFLLTDGEAKDDLSKGLIRKFSRYCRSRKIKINVVHFCFEPREKCTLIALAEKTGGQHRFVTLRELAHAKAAAANTLY